MKSSRSRKGHTHVLQPGQLRFISFSVSGPPPGSNPLLASTLIASDHSVAEITLSMDEMLILTKPSGQMCPRGWSKVRPKGCLMSNPWSVKVSWPQVIRKTLADSKGKARAMNTFYEWQIHFNLCFHKSKWSTTTTTRRQLTDENSWERAAEQDGGHAATAPRWVVTRKRMVAAIATTVLESASVD